MPSFHPPACTCFVTCFIRIQGFNVQLARNSFQPRGRLIVFADTRFFWSAFGDSAVGHSIWWFGRLVLFSSASPPSPYEFGCLHFQSLCSRASRVFPNKKLKFIIFIYLIWLPNLVLPLYINFCLLSVKVIHWVVLFFYPVPAIFGVHLLNYFYILFFI